MLVVKDVVVDTWVVVIRDSDWNFNSQFFIRDLITTITRGLYILNVIFRVKLSEFKFDLNQVWMRKFELTKIKDERLFDKSKITFLIFFNKLYDKVQIILWNTNNWIQIHSKYLSKSNHFSPELFPNWWKWSHEKYPFVTICYKSTFKLERITRY